jgi:hypothetical protein
MEALNFKIPDMTDPSGHIMQLAVIFSQITGAGATLPIDDAPKFASFTS